LAPGNEKVLESSFTLPIFEVWPEIREVGTVIYYQCCGAETFCFRSGSDFQKVSAPAPAPALEPAPAPTLALYLPFITDLILNCGFFMFFMKEYQPNSHAGFHTI
jgi:hypothetical protein